MEEGGQKPSQRAPRENKGRKGGGGGGGSRHSKPKNVKPSAEPESNPNSASAPQPSPPPQPQSKVQKRATKRQDPNASTPKASKPRKSKAESTSLDTGLVEEEGSICAAFYEDAVTSLREYQEYLISVLPSLTQHCTVSTAPRGLLNRMDSVPEPPRVETACMFPSFPLVMASLGLLARHASRPSSELLADEEGVREATMCAQLIAAFCLIPPELFPSDEDRFASPLNNLSAEGPTSPDKHHGTSGKKKGKGVGSSSASGGLSPLELFQRSLSSSSISSVTGNRLAPKDPALGDTNAMSTNTTYYTREERDSVDYLISTAVSLVSRLSSFGSGASENHSVESVTGTKNEEDGEGKIVVQRVPSLDKLLFHEQLRVSALYLLSALLIRYPKSVNAVSHFPQLFPPVDIRVARSTTREKHPLLTPLLTDPCFPVRCAASFALCRLLRHCHTQLQLAEEDPLTAAKRIQELQEEEGNGESGGATSTVKSESELGSSKPAARSQAYRAPTSSAARGHSFGPQSFYSLSGQGGRIIDAVHDTLLWGLESNRVDDPARCAQQQQPTGEETETDSSQLAKSTAVFVRIGTSGLILAALAALVTASPYARCPYAAYIMTNKIFHFPTVIEFLFGVHRTARISGSSHTGSGSSISGYFLNALTFCAAVLKQTSLVPHLTSSLRRRSRSAVFSGADAAELATPKQQHQKRSGGGGGGGKHASGSWERLAVSYSVESQKVRESRDLFSVLFALCLPRIEAWRCALFAAKNYSWVVDCYAEEFLGASLALLQAGRTLTAKQAAQHDGSQQARQRIQRNRRSIEQSTDTSRTQVSLTALLAAMGKTASRWGLPGTTRLRTVALCNSVASVAMAEQTPTRFSEAVDLCLCMWQFVVGSLVEGFDAPKNLRETTRGASETHAKKRASLAVRQHALAFVLSLAVDYHEPSGTDTQLQLVSADNANAQRGSPQETGSAAETHDFRIPPANDDEANEKEYYSMFRVVAIRSLALRCIAQIGDDAVVSFIGDSEQQTAPAIGLNILLQIVCDYAACRNASNTDPRLSAHPQANGEGGPSNGETGSVAANSDGCQWDVRDAMADLQMEALSTVTMLAWKYPSLCAARTVGSTAKVHANNGTNSSATVAESTRSTSEAGESSCAELPSSSHVPISWCLAFIDVAGYCSETTACESSHGTAVQRKAMLILENACTLLHTMFDENQTHPLLCPESRQQLSTICTTALSSVNRADTLFVLKLADDLAGAEEEHADGAKPIEATCTSSSAGVNTSFTSSWATSTLTANERGGVCNSAAQRQRPGPKGHNPAPSIAPVNEVSTVWSTVGQGLRMIGDLMHVLGKEELITALQPNLTDGSSEVPPCFADECLAVLLRHVCTNAELKLLGMSALAAGGGAQDETSGVSSRYFYAYLGNGTSREATKLRWGAAYAIGVSLDRSCVFDASPVRAVAGVKALINLVKEDASTKVKRQAIQALLRIPVSCMEPAFVNRVAETKDVQPVSADLPAGDEDTADLNAALLRCVCAALETVDTPVSSAGDSQGGHQHAQSSAWDRGNLFSSASGALPSWQQSNARRYGRNAHVAVQRTEAVESFRSQLKEAVHTILQTRAPTAALQRVLSEHNAIIEASTAAGDGQPHT